MVHRAEYTCITSVYAKVNGEIKIFDLIKLALGAL